MSVAVHTYTATLRSGASSYPLSIVAGSVTLDEAWAPYVQSDFSISTPSQTVQNAMDPRNTPRVRLVVNVTYPATWNGPGAPAPSTRTLDLGLRSRVIDRLSGETKVAIASDEALLQDYALVSTTPDTSALALQDSLRDIVNSALARIGASLAPPSVVTRTNLFTDPLSASTAAFGQSYGGGGAGALSRVSGSGPPGVSNGYIRNTVTTAGTYFDTRLGGTGVNVVTPGQTYVGSAWMRSTVAGPITTYIQWSDASGVLLSTTTKAQGVNASGSWQRLYVSDVAPPTAARATLIFRVIATIPVGASLDLTGGQTELGTTPSGFLYGDLPPIGLFVYSWTGAANASPSIETKVTPGAVDADFTTLAPGTNLLLDPGAEVVTANWIQGGGCTIARSTAFFAHGASSCQMTMTNTSGAVFMTASGTSGLPANVGSVYTALASVHATAAGATAIISVRFLNSSGATLRTDSLATLVPIPTATNIWAQVAVTSAPAPAGTSTVTAYVSVASTASGRLIYVDDGALFEGTGLDTDGATLMPPFNGATPDTSLYRYDWTGTANASTSTRTPQFDRPASLLTLTPGEDLWTFLAPLLTSAGMRLFCDESRVWRLVNSTYYVEGSVTVATGSNLTSGEDTISRDNAGDWYDAVVVEYTWNDQNTGLEKKAWDVASLTGWTKVLLVEYARPFPGPGAANYILGRSTGRGRVIEPRALSDYSVTPGQTSSVSMPDTVTQTGIVSSVQWDFGNDEMTVKSRGLTDTPSSAWIMLATGQKWTDSPAGQSWIAEVV